jgi:hypothetical protein
MAAPRVIGMLGGMSWESSAEYYRLANELVRERLGGLHIARRILASVDFADIEAMQVSGEWEAAGKALAEAARGLEGGAELLLLCTNSTRGSAAGGDADPVSLRVGEDTEAGAGDVLGGLNNGAAKLFSLGECGVDILDADEEEHFVLGALARADRNIGAAFGSCVDERVTRERTLGGDLPAEQVSKEGTRGVGVNGTDLGVNHGMGHDDAPKSMRRDQTRLHTT